MDGFEVTAASAPVLVIAATNRPEVLDPALKRSGRFDRTVTVSAPDAAGRALVLGVRARLSGMRFGRDCDFADVVRRSWGYTGSDLERTLNEAGLLAARRRRDAVAREDLLESLERVVGGIARPSFQVSPFEKEVVARHEVGHALVACVAAKAVSEAERAEDKGSLLSPKRRAAALETPDKISIIPRGSGALGYTANLPPSEESGGALMTLREMKARLCTFMGGRAAERACYGPGGVTSGSSDDLDRATRLAQAIVAQFGLGEGTGPVSLGMEPLGPAAGAGAPAAASGRAGPAAGCRSCRRRSRRRGIALPSGFLRFRAAAA